MNSKIRVLALCDYGCSTGFGQVASNIMQRLDASGLYDLTIIGINYDPAEDVDIARWPGKIIPAVTVADMYNIDVYGRQRFLNELGKGIYDLVFIIQDTFIIQTIINEINETRDKLSHKFATIMYYPIDATPKKEWIEKCVALIDFPVPYTQYAKNESINLLPEVEGILQEPIYHGTNLKDFFYIEDREVVDKFRNQYFNGEVDDCFLITNVNRNQPRKDVMRSFAILKELRNRGRNDAKMYLHMAHNDSGGNLLVMADYFKFKINDDFILPSPKAFSVNQGLPIEIINLIYNASDMVLSTTLGEGWGLSITEAMATRTPLVIPDNTSLHEMAADNRAYLVPSGADQSMWFCLGSQDNERIRPLMSVESAADRIEQIMDGQLPDIKAAEAWAKSYSWDNVCKDWLSIFEKAYKYAVSLAANSVDLNRQQRRAIERKRKKVAL